MEAKVAPFEKNGEPWKRTILPGGGTIEEIDIPVPPATKSRVYTRLQFRSLFSFAEQIAITTAAKTDIGVEVFLGMMNIAEEIDLDYPDTIAGLDYLVSKELITEEKKGQILAP